VTKWPPLLVTFTKTYANLNGADLNKLVSIFATFRRHILSSEAVNYYKKLFWVPLSTLEVIKLFKYITHSIFRDLDRD